jgi:outer membrane protein insertion porin family
VYQDSELLTSAFSSTEANEWVQLNGEPFTVFDPNGNAVAFGTKARSLEVVTGWTYDTRNAALFPTAGTRAVVSLNTAVPGSEIEYAVLSTDFTKYIDLPGRWLFKVNSDFSYGDAFGDTTALPPFRNRYGGGPGSVRGFKESYLGPRDSIGNPYGGNLLFANQFELVIPTPAKIGNTTRMGLFFDVGGVFSTGGVNFRDKLGDITDEYDFSYDKLKKSVGLGVEWLAPLGLLRFSYSTPLNADDPTDRFYGDEVERFQFSIGNAF